MALRRSRFPARMLLALGVGVGLPLTALSLYMYFKSAETRQWAEMRAWCEQTAREVRARDSRRPVLRGEPVPGNAWDDYDQALAAISYPADLAPATLLIHGPPPTDDGKLKALLSRLRELTTRYGPVFGALRRGASRSEAKRDVDWQHYPNQWVNKLVHLPELIACQARFLVEDGRPREAMELLLDAGQFAEDIARNGESFYGVWVLSNILEELKPLLSPGVLSREDHLELVRELELLDRAFPVEGAAYALESMTNGFQYLRLETLDAIVEPMGISDKIRPTWWYGFSERLVISDAFRMELAQARLLAAAAGKPWKEAREIEESIAVERLKTRNPLVKTFAKISGTLSDHLPRNLFRECRAHLRLVLGAAGYRTRGQVPELRDPYGDKIRSSVSGSRLKLWSVGGDGVDDGGSGEWNFRKGKDLVLEVER